MFWPNCSNIWQGTFSLPSNCLNQEEILSEFCNNNYSKYTQTKKKKKKIDIIFFGFAIHLKPGHP